MIWRGHQQATVWIDEAADGVHVPHVILVRVHRIRRRHHVERSDADIAKRLDWPAVVPIGPGKSVGEVLADLVPIEQRSHVDTSRNGQLERGDSLAQTDARSGGNGRVLL